MKFLDIAIGAAQADNADPRTTPADPKADQIVETPKTLENSDQPPSRLVLALEGTAGQTATVTVYALDEGQGGPFSEPPAASSRRFYQVAAAIVLTVGGTLSSTPCFPGKLYFRITSAPANAARLRIGYAV